MKRAICISKDNAEYGFGYYVDLGSTTLESQDSKNIGFSKSKLVALVVAKMYSVKYGCYVVFNG